MVNKYVAVSKIQNLLPHSALQKSIYDLKCCISLAGTGSHDQQQPILSSGNCIQGSVYCFHLVVAWSVCVLTRVIWLVNYFLLVAIYTGATICTGTVTFQQFFWRGEVL